MLAWDLQRWSYQKPSRWFRWMLAVLLCAGVGCRDSGTWAVSVGARGSVSTMYGACGPPTGTPGHLGVRVDSGRYEALSPGTARFRCADGDVILEVREPARITIRPVPSVSSGRRLFYGATVHDAAGVELDLGDDATLLWTFGGSLSERPNPGCGDIIPICPTAVTGFAVAGEPGVGTVSVSFGSLSATSTTMVTAR